MNPYAFLPLLTFCTTTALGCYILYRDPKNRLNILYSLFTFALATWALGTFLSFTSLTSEMALYWNKLTVMGSIFIPVFLLHFFLIFTKRNFILRNRNVILLYLPSLFFIFVNLTTNLINESATPSWWGYKIFSGILFIPIAFYIIGYFIVGIFLCSRFYSKTQSAKEKNQAKFLIISVVIPLAGGVTTEAIPSLVGFEMIPLSTAFITMSAVIIAYTMFKHELMRPILFGIQRKLITGFLVVALLVGTVGYISVNESQKALQESIGGNSIMLATESLDKMDRSIYNRIEEFQVYSKDLILQETVVKSNQEFEKLDDIQDYIDERDIEWTSVSKEEITTFMQELINNNLSEELRERLEVYEEKYDYGIFGEVFVTNKYGANVAQTGKTSDYYQADEDWWQNAEKDGLYVGDVDYDESAGVYSTSIGIRIADEDGNFIGVIKVVLDIEEVIGIMGELKLSSMLEGHEAMRHKTMHFKLLNEDGKVIYSTKEFEFFEDASDQLLSRLYEHEGEHVQYFIGEGDEPGEGEELFAHACSRGYKEYKGLGWLLVVEYETEEIFAPIFELRNFILIFSSVVTLFAILAGVFVSRSFSQPIIKLKDTAIDIGKGNLNAKIEVKSNDELGELASAFSQMTENLKKSKRKIEDHSKTLENRVAKRTKELNEKVVELEKRKTATLNILEDLQGTMNHLKVSQSKIELQNIKLKKMDRIKSNFLNVTSHELRTPLTGIKGYVRMMMDEVFGKVSEEQVKTLDIVLRTANRLDNLIQDILDISQLQSGTMSFISEETDLGSMMVESIETIQPSADLKGINVESVIEDDLPKLDIDHERIKQVILNILSNAIKFSSEDSNINVQVKEEKDNVLFGVQDFGRGVPKNKQKKIFETFYQVDGGMDRKFGGVGLGLAISHGIVLAHGGRIWVESTVGKGSTFKFTLPLNSVKDIEGRFKELNIL